MTARQRARSASRFALGTAVIAAVVGGALLAIPSDLPGVRTVAASTQVLPASADSIVTCAGPFRALGRDTSDAQQMQVAGRLRVLAATDGGDLIESSLLTPGLDDAAAAVFTVPVAGGGARVGAAQSVSLSDDDIAGFAASGCRPAAMQAWLVGGSAEVGTSDVLSLANPGEVASTVTITVFGAEEQQTSTVVVPSFTQTAMPLAALAIGQSDPVVFVSAEGAPVRAALQSSIVRTLDPGGIDWQDSAGTPERSLVLAGVQVVVDRSEEGLSVLRLMAPEADASATVRVRRAGDDTDAAPAQTIPLTAGVPAEVGFPGLPAGVYSVHIDAEEPIVAAAWQATGIHSGSDFAWMTPAPVIEDAVIASVPSGAGARLHLVADTAATEVRVTDLDRETSRTITLDAGGSAVVTVRAGASFVIEADAGIHAAVAMSGRDALAGWPLWPGDAQTQPLTVYP